MPSLTWGLNFKLASTVLNTSAAKSIPQSKNSSLAIILALIDTRKTIAGLRQLQKYAVRVGSGFNHRLCLDEMILVKDNHLKIMGNYSGFLRVPKGCKIEIEAQSLKEFLRSLSFKPDIVMLDNMKIPDIQKAVEIRNKLKINGSSCLTKLEASGSIHLGNVKKYAATGVEIISIGELTDSIESVDISLDIA